MLYITDSLNQMALDQQLLDMARDYFHFVTKFFDVIKVSATHIYHSALELSPTSSLIREHYHCLPFRGSKPRVVYGLHSSWDQPVTIGDDWFTYAWSPCGKFFSRQLSDSVEVRDALTFEKHSNFQPIAPSELHSGVLAYSSDGCSLAGCFDQVITIWDIQTGGVIKGIECRTTSHSPQLLVWSLDGTTISTISEDEDEKAWVVSTYDVASEAEVSTSILLSGSPPCIWPHNNTVQAMTTLGNNDNQTIINIVRVHPIPTNELIKSFSTMLSFDNTNNVAFSPSTYRISATDYESISVFNIQSPMVLLQETECFCHSWFSPDGMFLAADCNGSIHVWKYSSEQACYITWGVFPLWSNGDNGNWGLCEFSPHSSSMLVLRSDFSSGYLELQNLDAPPTDPFMAANHCHAFSSDGTYVVTAPVEGDTITITNLHDSSSVSFKMDFNVFGLALTGNVLLVYSDGKFSGWLITAEHTLDQVLAYNDIKSHMEVPVWRFWAEGSVGVLYLRGGFGYPPRDCIYYNTETGEELEYVPAEIPLHPEWMLLEMHGSSLGHPDSPIYSPLLEYKDHSEDHLLVSKPWYEGGWVKYPEGEYQHQFWLPNRWQSNWDGAHWIGNFSVLQINTACGLVIIKF